MMKQFGPAVLVLAGLVGWAGQASAQVGIAVRASTLGAGGEVSYRLNRFLGIRAGGNYLTFTRNATIQGINYDVTPKFQSGTAILDLHPMGSSLHLSAGMVWNSNRGNVAARLTGPITIGPQTYQPSDVGTLTGLVDYKTKYAPYAGIGFSGRSRISVLFDMGVVFSGYPQLSLTGSTSLTGQAKQVFDQNVQQEIDQVQGEIQKHTFLKYHPVVSLGLKVGM